MAVGDVVEALIGEKSFLFFEMVQNGCTVREAFCPAESVVVVPYEIRRNGLVQGVHVLFEQCAGEGFEEFFSFVGRGMHLASVR